MPEGGDSRSFPVIIISPDGEVYRDEAVSIVVPAVDGYMGVMRGHVPMITVLDVGEMLIRTPDEHVLSLAVAGGFMEVRRDETVILCDHAEFREDIDVIRATKAEERARERLTGRMKGINVERAQVALRKAINREKVAQHKERKKIIG